MAATTFSNLYGYIRAVLGDLDAQKIMYSNDFLRSMLRLELMTLCDEAIAEEVDSDPEAFTKELTAVQQALVIYSVARSVVSPKDNFFHYKTPVLTITRKGGALNLIAHLDNQITRLCGGAFPIGMETDLEAYIARENRYYDELCSAIAESP